jgi:hypothetical protein
VKVREAVEALTASAQLLCAASDSLATSATIHAIGLHDCRHTAADQGLIKESAAAPDRWMIVLASDPSDDD